MVISKNMPNRGAGWSAEQYKNLQKATDGGDVAPVFSKSRKKQNSSVDVERSDSGNHDPTAARGNKVLKLA